MIRASALTAIAIVASAVPATAQLLQDEPTVVIPPEPPLTPARSVFARDREVAVADRMLPAFSAKGMTVGAFDVFPGLAVGGLYTSNIFANNADKHADAGLMIRPELTVRTSSGPYRVTAYARGDVRRFTDKVSENTEEVLGGLQGNVAVGALSALSAGVSYGSLINPRFAPDSPVDAAKPLEYNALNAFASGSFEGSNTRVILRADVADIRFRDTPSRSGGTIFTRDRNRTRVQGLLRVERALSPSVSLYGAGTVNTIDYRYPTTIGQSVVTRDSRGYGLYVGSSFELTSILRGDVRAGYIRQIFDLDGLRPIAGFGTLGSLVYFPNRLWTFTARVESSVQDSGVPGTGGVLHRGGSLRADNELRRYIVLSLEGGYFRDTYRGLPRRDKLPFASAGLTYLSRNHWNARLGYRYLSRDCSCTGGVTDFDDHRVTATLTFQN
ncbi:outer membrane beta-barrel protein [Microvirga sp. SRT01]|uniref:Outer membrane beta-barrel protein n=1 Tax=Sphingomonas longa TaxID=2778730 RepID=A0ABS2D966_9SPHN|nr:MULTISPECIES: outer membrane beta-barrel protein [Alphaproteobacteria]MBM6577482.1 outer membrane beta-barrel protein [Sphingomonas sp. BT552]MBR7710527.1 outer membrane beta-barrel protein [Microvirga sp. SRT01]